MGQKTVEMLAADGFVVFALDRVECAARENVIPIKADLTDAASIEAAFNAVSEVTRELYGIINLAGIYTLDSLAEIPPDNFERAFRINLGGAFLINRTFLPLLGQGSRIVTVTSELAVRDPLPFTGLYAVTKTALDKYCYSLRMELQLLGIHVSVLRAGAVDTGMIGDSARQLDEFCEKTGLYSCNSARFRAIVDRVEARRIAPEKAARKLTRIVTAKRPKFSYSVNRNPLLILFDKLPKRLRFFIIKKILK